MTDITEKIASAIDSYVDAVGCAPGRIVAASDVRALLVEATATRFGKADRYTHFAVNNVPVVFEKRAPPGMVYCDEGE